MITPNAIKFFKKATLVHNNKYDYSLAIYKTIHTPLTIICPEHGEFLQSPNNHRKGMGCPKCGRDKTLKSKKESRDLEEENIRFKEKAKSIHGESYGYTEVRYLGHKTKVKILCNYCKKTFMQSPTYHLQGQGCPHCARDRSSEVTIGRFSKRNRKLNATALENFIERARLIHGEGYDYSQVNYIDTNKKVEIICRKHGPFEQSLRDHLQGKGCPKCGNIDSKQELALKEWLSEIGILTEHRYKDRYEIDLYLPEHKIGIEHNGLHWHSEMYKPNWYHSEKSKYFLERGIRIIHIWEDEQRLFPEKIRGYLMHQMGITQEKVYARKCSVEEIDSKTANLLLDKHHLLGKTRAKHYIGLFSPKRELVAVGAFSTNSSNRGRKEWEMTRYVTSGISVVGGLGKIISNFKKILKIDSPIFSYTDNDKYSGNSYEKAGFRLLKNVPPDYKTFSYSEYWRHPKQYTKRSNLEKILGDKFDPSLTEHTNCLNNKIYRVYDSGKKKWVYD